MPTHRDAAEPDAAAAAAPSPPHYLKHRQRARARFLSGDAETVADYELLELLLFYAIDRVDVRPLAKDLLKEFGGLGGVLAADRQRLNRYPRINERSLALFAAVRELSRRLARETLLDRPVISSWAQLVEYCRLGLAEETTERFRILFLDRKNRLIADELQQRGTVDHVPVYPREVIKRALELSASALILVHNHPSGDPTPSSADVEITRQVREIAERLGICVHDHVIVGRQGTQSLRQLGLI
ncbi:MAG: DNA repair protein RadC [Rhodospirillales bacterium]|nr:DNA repair protein RadC [Rhodospirillales bacterium]